MKIPRLTLSENTFIIYIVTIYENAPSEYVRPLKNCVLYSACIFLLFFTISLYPFKSAFVSFGMFLSLIINDNIIWATAIISTILRTFINPALFIKLPNINGNII